MYIASTTFERWGEVKALTLHEEIDKQGRTEELFCANSSQV